MDPSTLIAPPNAAGLPAPYWFLVLFKVLGFVLHASLMNLWLAGVPLAMLLRGSGAGNGRRLGDRVMHKMPVIIAFGVNLGVVPLLFLQVAYYRVFYPATILMAWPWISIVALLGLAYYGVYAYAFGESGAGVLGRYRRVVGWGSAALFVAIGFIFANALSLMTRVDSWLGIWERSNIGGAVTGTGHNLSDPTVLPRYFLMAGLALTSTAVFLNLDTAFSARRESASYRAWASGLAFKAHTAGLAVFAAAASVYVFSAWPDTHRKVMFAAPYSILTILTALSPGLPWLLSLAQRSTATGRLAVAAAAAQFIVLALNGVSRQIVQNLELRPFMDVTAHRVQTHTIPLVLFLLCFTAGLGVLGWMLKKLAAAGPAVSGDGEPGAAGFKAGP